LKREKRGDCVKKQATETRECDKEKEKNNEEINLESKRITN